MRVMLQTRSWKGKLEGGAGVGTPNSISSSGWPADGESPVGSSLFGVWPTAEEWMGSLRSWVADWEGFCFLSAGAWGGCHSGISAWGNASDGHQGPLGCLWETESKVLKQNRASLLFLHPSTWSFHHYQRLAIMYWGQSQQLRELRLGWEEVLALLMVCEAFLLLVCSSWSHFLSVVVSFLCKWLKYVSVIVGQVSLFLYKNLI